LKLEKSIQKKLKKPSFVNSGSTESSCKLKWLLSFLQLTERKHQRKRGMMILS